MNRKIKNARKVLSAILALTFVIMLSSMPALAEEAPDAENGIVESDNADILSVVVPTTVDISLDPLDLNGSGPIYSDLYTIANCGDTEVQLTFNDIQVVFANGSDYVALSQPYEEQCKSDLKAIYLTMNFGTSGIPPLVLTNTDRWEPVSILLDAPQPDGESNSQLAISFSGNLNPYPSMAWSDGDVRINLTYTLVTIPPPKVDDEESDSEEEVSPEPETSPEPSSEIDTSSPEPSSEINITTPAPPTSIETAAPEQTPTVDASTPEPTAAVETTTESSASNEAAAPEPVIESGSS